MLSSSKRKKSRTEKLLSYLSVKIEEIDLIFFSFSSSFSPLIFIFINFLLSFLCFSTMPFSQTFFATFFPTLLVTARLLPRRKSSTVSSILLHFFLISLSDYKILSSDSRVHFCISICNYTCKVLHTCTTRNFHLPSNPITSFSIFFYKSETFSPYIATFIFTSLYDCEAFILT